MKTRCLNLKHVAGGLLAGLLMLASIAQATIPTPGYPRVNYNSTGVASFNSATNEFVVTAEPLDVIFTPISSPAFVFAPRSVNIHILADGAGCDILGGNPGGGPDIEVIGDVLDPVTFVTIYSGVLLTGDIVDMGFSPPAGSTSTFDFRFTNVAGLLTTDPNWPAGQDLGVLLTSEQPSPPLPNSPFVDCDTDFDGLAKGNMGPIDPDDPGEVCDLSLEKNAYPDVLNIGQGGWHGHEWVGPGDSDTDSDSGWDWDGSGDSDDSDTDSDSDSEDSDHGAPACGCKGRIKELTIRYNLPTASHVEVRRANGVVLFGPQLLQPNEEFTFAVKGKKIVFLVNGSSVEMLKTKCKNPIGPGTQIGDSPGGDLVVVSGKSKFRNGKPLCPAPGTTCGPENEVTYTYDLINNGTTVTDVVVFDDQLGVIDGSPIASIANGEMVTLEQTTCIFEDTINIATATGVQGDAVCESNEATETVEVNDCANGDSDSDSGIDGDNSGDSDDSDSDSGRKDCDRDERRSCYGGRRHHSDSDSHRDWNWNGDSDDSDSDSGPADCDEDDSSDSGHRWRQRWRRWW